MTGFIRISLGCLVLLAGVPAGAASPPSCLLLKLQHYFDGRRDQRPASPRYAFIRDQKIISLTTAKPSAAKSCQEIDLSALTVTPGLIDLHSHVFLVDPSYGRDLSGAMLKLLAAGEAARLELGRANARSLLLKGFTSIRDLGNSGRFLDVRLRQEGDKDPTQYPRLFVSGPGLVDRNGQFGEKVAPEKVIQEYEKTETEAEAKQAVARFKKEGVDWIKVYADNDPARGGISLAHLRVIVKAAHGAGLRVAVHATQARSVAAAVRAGADSVEHAFHVDRETLSFMAKRRIYLVPTDLGPSGCAVVHAHNSDPYYECETYRSDRKARLQAALQAGVRVAYGSDIYMDKDEALPDRGSGALDGLIGLAEEGLTPLQTLGAATYDAAKVLNKSDLGEIRAGAQADLVAFSGDPVRKIEDVKNVAFVMKAGQVIRNPEAEAPASAPAAAKTSAPAAEAKPAAGTAPSP